MAMAVIAVTGCTEPLSAEDLLCREDPDCMSGYYCDSLGRCVLPENLSCTTGNDCPRGWFCDPGTGFCVLELPDDPCDPNPCTEEHKTQCTADGSNAVCSCDNGYHDEGGMCVENTTCQDNTCSNHGSCDDSSGSPVCTCSTGYAGDHCDTCDNGYHWNADGDACTSDPCDPNPCTDPHKGVCADEGGQAACSCDNGYHDEGGTCVEDTTCQDNTCSNHGSCDDSSGSPVCTCNTGYTGGTCDACDDGYVGYPDCQLSWPYQSRLVIALTAGKNPFIQNGGESDVLFFSITALDGPAGISEMTVEVNCPNGLVSEEDGEGVIYRSADAQTYEPISIVGEGAVTRYIPDSNFIRSGYVQEEMFAEGETKHYKFSPVMSGLAATEQCVVRFRVDAQTSQKYLYHPVEESILANPDGVCHERPPFFIWSDLSAAEHVRPTVDFWPCALLEGAEPQPWGSADFIQGGMDASGISVVLTAP